MPACRPAISRLTTWQTETASFLSGSTRTVIAEPTSVNKLVSELVEQAALAIWWEPLTQLVKLQVLRAIATNADALPRATRWRAR